GKTEAALLLYETLAARGATGLYFALPTQATSNQILGRVQRFLESAYPGEVHELHLVHGDAGLSERYERLKERAFSVRSVDGPARGEGGAVADSWFSRSKRALLAPVAVGTVDQALLGVLGVRHAFLRLHALAGKVVVIDEVHAYDTYTSGLLARLLAWLRALGTTVVLLSATLPASRRAALTRAFGGTAPQPCPYPRLTTVTGGRSFTETFVPKREPKSVHVRWRDGATLPEALATRLERGGCVAWIVNTVRAAQQTYRTLRRLKADGVIREGVAIDLIHARFPFDARAARERAAEIQFGPDGAKRPDAAILVGTQVLEQSLDLDFDLMITELAPVDLVLQRAGRLHRHVRPKELRGAFPEAELWVQRPDDEDGASGPSFGASKFIYAESVLLRSWLALRARDTILLPTDIEPLIE
ncbi:MAG: CRISPR-associated helicase Cas3', partial [Polyangiaceae bacterium]